MNFTLFTLYLSSCFHLLSLLFITTHLLYYNIRLECWVKKVKCVGVHMSLSYILWGRPAHCKLNAGPCDCSVFDEFLGILWFLSGNVIKILLEITTKVQLLWVFVLIIIYCTVDLIFSLDKYIPDSILKCIINANYYSYMLFWEILIYKHLSSSN